MFPSACSSVFHFGMSFNYPLNDEGKAAWFDLIIDDFEDYIENYWSFTKGIDCEEDYPISFQVDYVDNQFLDDFIVEDSFAVSLVMNVILTKALLTHSLLRTSPIPSIAQQMFLLVSDL